MNTRIKYKQLSENLWQSSKSYPILEKEFSVQLTNSSYRILDLRTKENLTEKTGLTFSEAKKQAKLTLISFGVQFSEETRTSKLQKQEIENALRVAPEDPTYVIPA